MFISLSLSGSVLACKGQGEVIPARTAQGKETGLGGACGPAFPSGRTASFLLGATWRADPLGLRNLTPGSIVRDRAAQFRTLANILVG